MVYYKNYLESNHGVKFETFLNTILLNILDVIKFYDNISKNFVEKAQIQMICFIKSIQWMKPTTTSNEDKDENDKKKCHKIIV